MTIETENVAPATSEVKNEAVEPNEVTPEGEEAPAAAPKKEEGDPADKDMDELPLPIPDDEADEEGEEEENAKKKADKLPKWAEKRLSKKERELQEARDHAARAEAELQARNQPQTPRSQMDLELPNRADFETDEEYTQAVVLNTLSRERVAARNEQARQAYEAQETDFRSKWFNSEDEGLKKYSTFDENFARLNDRSFPANRMMAEAIVESPYKVDILNFLGENVDHAKKIALMTPTQAVRKINELEQRFEARKKGKITKAAAIINPIKGNKGATAPVNPSELSPDDFKTWYDKEFA